MLSTNAAESAAPSRQNWQHLVAAAAAAVAAAVLAVVVVVKLLMAQSGLLLLPASGNLDCRIPLHLTPLAANRERLVQRSLLARPPAARASLRCASGPGSPPAM